MGTILDKIFDEEDDRMETIRKQQEAQRARIWNVGKNGLEYSHINISKITRNVWVGEFSFTFFQRQPAMNNTITGFSPENVIQKIENFLKVELKLNEYTIVKPFQSHTPI
jgi:hypothetical protein